MNPENAKPTSLSKASEFKQSVLQLQPRLAVFDCDGTLWSGDAGFGFFDWELKRGLVARPSLTDRTDPSDFGYRLGTVRGRDLWCSVEDSALLVGPPLEVRPAAGDGPPGD